VCAGSGTETFGIGIARVWQFGARVNLQTFVSVLHETSVACALERSGSCFLARRVFVAGVVLARIDFVAFGRFDRVLTVTGFADARVLPGTGLNADGVRVARVFVTRIDLFAAEARSRISVLTLARRFVRAGLTTRCVDVTRVRFARIFLSAREPIAFITGHTRAHERARTRFLARRVRVARILKACVDLRAVAAIGLEREASVARARERARSGLRADAVRIARVLLTRIDLNALRTSSGVSGVAPALVTVETGLTTRTVRVRARIGCARIGLLTGRAITNPTFLAGTGVRAGSGHNALRVLIAWARVC
jgi:hypothetical protein